LAALCSGAADYVEGWLFASARGWSVSWFFIVPLPMLTHGNRSLVRAFDGWHQNFMWALLVMAGLHIAAAFVHVFYYRNGGAAWSPSTSSASAS
jgi:cytochrome b561